MPQTDFAMNVSSEFAQSLISADILTESELNTVSIQARDSGKSVYQQLYNTGWVDQKELLHAAASAKGLPLFDVAQLKKDLLRTDLIADKVAITLQALPLYKRGRKLFVAISDPENITAIDEVRFHTGLDIEPVLVDMNILSSLIEEITAKPDLNLTVKHPKDTGGSLLVEGIDELTQEDDDEPGDTFGDLDINVDTPVVRFVNTLLLDAVAKRASDIHVEPYESKIRIRYRIDGVLHEVASPPKGMHSRMVSRIKVMAQMNLAERRMPQDGRIRMTTANQQSIDLRVSTLPTLYGEKAALRILHTDNSILNLRGLGFEKAQLDLYLKAIKEPYGMILVTGPTGSGKTVSIYAALNLLNFPDKNISTIEDPIEINLNGVNQVNINRKAGLHFAGALRAFLRQDPDIIMVGEMRDQETAEIGISAAQTGHLVLSTLHANDAPSTLTRLTNMGIEPYNVATSTHFIMAQRLARKLCGSCKRDVTITAETLLAAGFLEAETFGFVAYEPVGCSACVNGYRGRTGIYEVLPVSESIADIIMKNGNHMEIQTQAIAEGMMTLRRAGLEKVKNGITSLQEVKRVTSAY